MRPRVPPTPSGAPRAPESSGHRRAPRPLAFALERLERDLAPQTTLARVQAGWGGAVGEAIAAEANPVAERDGILTVRCASAVWANELELMAPALVAQINERLGGPVVRGLRCRAV
jgi:predicted nucleic acid-binding Zn ribbon protein